MEGLEPLAGKPSRDATRCEELGVSAYLLKPVRQSELRQAIVRVLGGQDRKEEIPLVTRYSLHATRDPEDFLRVLVAEDNKVNQFLATRLLEKRGHRVAIVTNGRGVLDALKKENYDLILMDVHMPEMDGFAAIREREKEAGFHQPVIPLTANTIKGNRERCLAAGMDGYLSKPIRPQELDEVLDIQLACRTEVDRTVITNKESAGCSPKRARNS